MLSSWRFLRRGRHPVLLTVVIMVLMAALPVGVWFFREVIRSFPTCDFLLGIESESVDGFLAAYKDFCAEHVVRKKQGASVARIGSTATSAYGTLNSTHLCPCVPDTLAGRLNSSSNIPSIEELERRHQELNAGGSWSPQHCVARHRVAIIIPFRNRDYHLRVLLSVLHPMLQRQQLQYTIFLVEQSEPAVFNKASLMNVGFVESRALDDFDCVIFHDVDMIPEDDRNFYVCSHQPRHVGAYLRQWDYKLPYANLFGGVTAFRPDHFKVCNGFSNQYYGWGGEDDDMFQRVKAQNFCVARFSRAVARYQMFEHRRDVGNPYNMNSETGYSMRPENYKVDGLNSLNYTTKSTELRRLYTRILVSLPPHPPGIRALDEDKIYDRDSGHIVRNCSFFRCTFMLIGAVVVTVVLFWAVHVRSRAFPYRAPDGQFLGNRPSSPQVQGTR